ncbi:PD-(D/E)XK nuclease family protein [uncultured Selenomonas sp.]|uniref:PDDEXK-like family protein n=1 Tax=uncultured Selenomonas sp. TaxID=159275 RepID=UPI0028DC7EAA|nr:PD-(D/E)XK nuclease family protein [uncultured Selenomonas sp.]
MALTEAERAVAFLDKVKPIIRDIHAKEAEKRARGETFNIFSVLGIETREFYICRMLGELLSPQGVHNAGAIFLKKFLEDVLKKSALAQQAEEAVVRCEDATKERRRIDLTIELDGKVIPIEAKINAEDQEHQLADYYREITNRTGKCDYICYLTKGGRNPSLNSMTSTSGNVQLNGGQIKRLSWKADIVPWLEACVALETVQRKTLVQNNIWQLIDTIRGWDNAMELQLKNLVKSDDDLDKALYIWQSVSDARNALWKNFGKEFELQMKGVYPLEKIPDKESDDTELDYWFEKPEQGNYGIGLILKNGGGEEHCIGFCLFGSDGRYKKNDDAYYTSDAGKLDKAKGCLYKNNFEKLPQLPSKLPWLYRENFPIFNGEEINFYMFTKGTAKLLLEENLGEYVKTVVDRIKKLTGWEKQQTTSCVATVSELEEKPYENTVSEEQ